MKKIAFLAFSVLLTFNAFAVFTTETLYVVGDGAGTGWDPGSALAMTKVSDNVFTWRGTLYGGGDPRFKFLSQRDWNPHVTCQKVTNGHTMVTLGEPTDLFFYETGNPDDNSPGGNDNAFKIAETGLYTIDIDLNTKLMVIAKYEVGDKSQLHIGGTAIGASYVAMTEIADGVFAWTGDLVAGNFQFFTESTGTDKVLEPTTQTNVSNTAKYDLEYYASGVSAPGNNFRVRTQNAGTRTILVDLNTLKMRIMQLNYDELRILGSALNEDATWHSGLSMQKLDDGGFVYIGWLYNRDGNTADGGDMGKFKFNNTGDLVFYNDTRVMKQVEIDNQYLMSLQSHADDNKFHVAESGIYTVYIDLKTMTMKFMKVDKSALYLVGIGDDAVAMTKDENIAGVFTWEGTLDSNLAFSFLNYSEYAKSSIVSNTDLSSSPVTLGTPYTIVSNLGEDATKYPFEIEVTEEDDYVITVNLNDMTVTVAKDGGDPNSLTSPSKEQFFSIASDNASLAIQMLDGKAAGQIDIYDITGKKIVSEQNVTSLNTNLPKGIYILKLACEGNTFSEKVIIN